MNKIYKVIFCKATQSWVAVSEMTKGQGKSSVRSILAGTTSSSVFSGRLKLLTLAVLLGLGFSQQTMAGQTPLHANDGADTNCVAINDVSLGSGVIGASNCGTYQVTDAEDISNKDRVSVYSDSKGQANIAIGGTAYIGTGLDIKRGATIDMGNNIVGNVKAGVADTDAANVSQITTYFHTNDTGSDQTGAGNATNKGVPNAIGGAKGRASLAAGLNAEALGEYATAIGTNAKATKNTSTAVGNGAKALNLNTIAIGNAATADQSGAMAIGSNAQATRQYATAFGVNAKASGIQSIALGAGTGTNIVEAKGSRAIAIGADAKAIGDDSIAIGTGNQVNGDHSGAFGDPSVIDGANSYSVGNTNTVDVAISEGVFVLGNSVNADVDNSVYLGNDSHATATAGKTKTSAGAVGTTSSTAGTGAYSNATIGSGSNAVTYSGFAGSQADVGLVTFGASGSERRLQNVAAGEISSTSTDAINGSQLYSVADTIVTTGFNINADKRGSGLTAADNVALGQTVKYTGRLSGVTTTVKDNEIQFAVNTDGKTTEITYVDNNGNIVTPHPDIPGVYLDQGNNWVPAASVTARVSATGALTVTGNKNADTDADTLAGTTYTAGDGTQRQLGETLNIIGATSAVTGITRNTDTAVTGAYSAKNVQTFISNGEVQIQFAESPKFGNIVINKDNGNTINGLANTTLTVAGFGTQGRAATEEQLSAVINNGWNFTVGHTGGTSSTHYTNGANVETVKLGDTINFVAGDNIDITQNGKKITISAKVMKGEKGDKGDTGATGAQGEKGEKGETGATGAKGNKGETGATGAKGDKGDTGAAGAKGDKGDTGAAGAQGEKGDTGATGAQGEKGEKGETGATGAKGDKGDTGATGAQGEKGEKGETGATGAKGDKGETGATGAKGDKGDTGAAGAKGDKGDTGAAGAQGEKGDTGATGAQGDKGEKGETGATGAKGDKGDTGAAGAKGEKGDTGATGAQGDKGEKGETGATGAQGDKGDTGAAGAKGDKGEKGDTGVAGAKGEKGDTGATGAQGEKGETGATGAQGEKGEKGETGATGAKGDKGEKGDTGAVGAQGEKGDTGAAGAQGEKGDTGATGAKGDKGDTGAAGAKGDKGEKGDTGVAGAKGEKGEKGDTGATGAQGDKGEKGETGATGAKGDKGDTGAAGAKGDKGDKGEKGDTGVAGAKGEKGDTGATGAQGEKGDTGATGAKGDKGEKGDKGDQGEGGSGSEWKLATAGDAEAEPNQDPSAVSGQTVTVNHGRNTQVSAVSKDNSGNYSYEIDVTGLPMEYLDASGNSLLNVGGKFYTAVEAADGTVSLTPATPAKVRIVSDKAMQLTNVAAGKVNSTSTDAINGSQLHGTAESIATALGGGASVNSDGTVSAPSYEIKSTQGGTTTAHTVGAALKALNDEVIKPITFVGDKGSYTAKLGQQVQVKGDGKNLSTSVSGDTLTIRMTDTPEFASVTANSYRVGDKTYIDKDGINANNQVIKNVAPGVDGTDAVNVNQLNNISGNLNKRINNVDKHARAGIAGALATAGLYQSYLPGHSMVAVGAGTYRGENALAIGVSRISDNGKIGIKLTGMSTSQGDVGGSVSVGYQW